MNLRMLVTVIAAVIGLAMIAYPPWTEVYTGETGGFVKRSLGYQFLWDKPAPIEGFQTQRPRIWSSRLSKQLFALFAITLIARKFAAKRAASEPAPSEDPPNR